MARVQCSVRVRDRVMFRLRVLVRVKVRVSVSVSSQEAPGVESTAVHLFPRRSELTAQGRVLVRSSLLYNKFMFT